MFEAEQCLEMRNYKYSFNQNYIIFWQVELVTFLFIVLCWHILFILSFGA